MSPTQAEHPTSQPTDAALEWAQMAPSQPTFAPGSGTLFSMYCDMTVDEDKWSFEWLKWVDKIVIFVRISLFYLPFYFTY